MTPHIWLFILPTVIGFILDLIFGDPQTWPHPVRWIGKGIHLTQRVIRRICQQDRTLFWGGVALWIIIVGGTGVITWLILYSLSIWAWWLAFIIQVWLSYTILATKCLKEAAMAVHDALNTGTVEDGRHQLSYIVGRDTQHLNAEQITRATVETVAENSVDGVIAPLFYLFIGGVPLAMMYKAVNTLDSMVGYKTPKYHAIGCFSAKLDDAFNYIPARISWLLLTLAAWCLQLNSKAAFLIGWRDRYQHKSPNCAWSEATVAGALGVRLGGPNLYFGEWVQKPWIGDEQRTINLNDIKTTIHLMYMAVSLAVILFTLLYMLFMISLG